jgi:superfamily II DNA/RNA helicase
MLKLGFKEDIDRILNVIKKQVGSQLQITLFSATIPRWVRDVANSYMNKSLRVIDLCQDLKNKTAKTVQHLAISCPF